MNSLLSPKKLTVDSIRSVITLNGAKQSNSVFCIEYQDGTIYKGEMLNKQKHGFGLIRYSNNDTYEGEFLSDEFNGKGKFISKSLIYDGFWLKGYPHR